MTNYQLIDKERHKNLSVATEFTGGLGYSVGAVILLDNEILAAQREYPIIFRKDAETGRFFPYALLGFQPDENLFINETGQWQATHIPLAVAKGPFMIGFQDVEGVPQQSICVDLDDVRVNVNGGTGKAILNADGSLSRYLEYVSKILLLINQSKDSLNQMVDMFVKFDLIEPLRLDIQFKNGEQKEVQGGFTIAAEKLAGLSAHALTELHKSGYLSAAYNICGSLENIQKLIDLKNKQLSN